MTVHLFVPHRYSGAGWAALEETKFGFYAAQRADVSGRRLHSYKHGLIGAGENALTSGRTVVCGITDKISQLERQKKKKNKRHVFRTVPIKA